MKRGIGLVVAMAAVLATGCGSTVSTRKATGTSIPGLEAKLANLKPFGIASCSYTVEVTTVSGGVPSPSDTKLVLAGSAELSEEGAKALRSRFGWKPIARTDIPGSLLAIVPAGDLLASREFNEAFEHNRMYCHGFVVMLARPESRTVFFVSHDGDHPIR